MTYTRRHAMEPKVSIVIPIYNVSQYLDQALESIKRQTLKDIEIICVNDGSTDNSLDIVKKWAEGDDRFVIIDKVNEGYGVAMNTGMKKATGEYIGILEPDDFVPLGMYEDLYIAASENDLDLVKADYYRFITKDDGSMVMQYYHLNKEGKYYNELLDPHSMPELICCKQNTWAGIYKRAFLEANNIRHNTTPGASFQDNGFFWQTYTSARRAMHINKPYYMNRRDNPNSSVKNKDKVYAINKEYDYIKGLLQADEDSGKWDLFKNYFYMSRFRKCVMTIRRIADEHRRPYVDFIYDEFRAALDAGDMDPDLFAEADRERFDLLMESPQKFYDDFARDAKPKVREDLLDRRKKRIHDLKAENKKLEKENEKLHEQIEEIRSSKSYKVARKLSKIIK